METKKNFITRLLLMSDDTWLRHANPWSAWTRIITCLPLLALSLWSRAWIGRWSILPIVAALLWIWLNPRVFPAPKSTNNWASKGVMGERFRMNRKVVPIPHHHVIAGNTLLSISGAGIFPFVYGVWQLNVWSALFGGLLMYVGKLWYFDRMVWLYGDMINMRPESDSWAMPNKANSAAAKSRAAD